MSVGLIIEADVREEMRQAGDWYEAREAGVGGRFAVVLDEYLQQILPDFFENLAGNHARENDEG